MVDRVRLRPGWNSEELRQVYAVPHDHRIYGRGHAERVDATIALARTVLNVNSVADLSCGNGAIAQALNAPATFLGDLGAGYPYQGPIEETIREIPKIDLFICSETIEHLDDPDSVLDLIGEKTEDLILSTPVDNFGDTNAQHYWGWSRTGVEQMIEDAGFIVDDYVEVDTRTYGEAYCYGIWRCS